MTNPETLISLLKNSLDVSSMILSIGLLHYAKKKKLPDIFRPISKLLIVLFATRIVTLTLSYIIYAVDEANNYTLPDWPFELNFLIGTIAFFGFYFLSFLMSLSVFLAFRKMPYYFIILSILVFGTSFGVFLEADWIALFKYLGLSS